MCCIFKIVLSKMCRTYHRVFKLIMKKTEAEIKILTVMRMLMIVKACVTFFVN